eukprot:TRINITY_DN9413_c0_g1_i1.p1 TRINITY_DN9413_c0_g1~~TRINITY_DN9413_c0_g1_i1.p1  ORF type:complete len:177 (-),score=27.81 TRINITY_DN9413_c0_g1_i1:212-742(-)
MCIRDRMRDMAALAALNPERAKSHLQSSGLAADVRLSMMKDMKLCASEQVQLRGDIIGSDRLRDAERASATASKPQDAVRRSEAYSQVTKDINNSSLRPEEKAAFLNKIPGSSESKARALHNYGDYNESGYVAARAASREYGRSNLHRVSAFECTGNKGSQAYSCNTHLASPQIVR